MSATSEQIDAVVEELWAGVVSQQEAYRSATGAYYQLLWTHVSPPSSSKAPDNLASRPTDQAAFPISGLPETMRSRMRINTYGKPDGWVMVLEYADEGVVFSRSIDCGHDASRSAAWQEMPTELQENQP